MKKKIITPLLQWIYLKNYQYDNLSSNRRTNVFVLGMTVFLIFCTVIPGILMIVGNENQIIYTVFSYFMLFATLIGACLFRIPYMEGKLNNYIPNFIFEEKQAEKVRKEQFNQAYNESIKPKNNDYWKRPYLNTLGLNANATPEEIKTAYRKKAMKWHPDRNKSPNAEAMFKMIKDAYEKLN